jgi:hypothetical protein
MHMRWEQLTFIHLPYPPADVQPLLPRGIELDTFDGLAWISLVPFVMRVTLPPRGNRPGRPLPFVGRFAETNVRTYVRPSAAVSSPTAASWDDGIWFFSLDAGSALGTLGGRIGYRLPYMYSAMSVDGDDTRIRYRCRRRFPGPRHASSDVVVDLGEPVAAATELDHWLSARWRLYSHMFGRAWYAEAQHEPWPLRTATLETFDDELVAAAGLPAPCGEPIVHYADAVTVRIGRPRPIPGIRSTA